MSRTPYAQVAGLYDGAAWLYSGGAIAAGRRWCGARARPGQRVLVAGCGTGLEAEVAARAGARVTAVDADAAMCRRAHRRLRRAGLAGRVRLVHGDVLAPSGRTWDLVLTCFFLNVFDGDRLSAVLDTLRTRTAPEGRLVVADFARVAALRPAARAYHDLPMRLFAGLGANARHAPHDLPGALAGAGLAVRQRRAFRLFGGGPAWIEALVAGAGP